MMQPNILDQSDVAKICVLRALVRRPDVLLIHRILDSWPVKKSERFLKLLRMYLDGRLDDHLQRCRPSNYEDSAVGLAAAPEIHGDYLKRTVVIVTSDELLSASPFDDSDLVLTLLSPSEAMLQHRKEAMFVHKMKQFFVSQGAQDRSIAEDLKVIEGDSRINVSNEMSVVSNGLETVNSMSSDNVSIEMSHGRGSALETAQYPEMTALEIGAGVETVSSMTDDGVTRSDSYIGRSLREISLSHRQESSQNIYSRGPC